MVVFARVRLPGRERPIDALREELAAIPKKLGMTMIYVTHDRTDVTVFGGSTVVLDSHPGVQDAGRDG